MIGQALLNGAGQSLCCERSLDRSRPRSKQQRSSPPIFHPSATLPSSPRARNRRANCHFFGGPSRRRSGMPLREALKRPDPKAIVRSAMEATHEAPVKRERFDPEDDGDDAPSALGAAPAGKRLRTLAHPLAETEVGSWAGRLPSASALKERRFERGSSSSGDPVWLAAMRRTPAGVIEGGRQDVWPRLGDARPALDVATGLLRRLDGRPREADAGDGADF